MPIESPTSKPVTNGVSEEASQESYPWTKSGAEKDQYRNCRAKGDIASRGQRDYVCQ
jgi:hypothetical protein